MKNDHLTDETLQAFVLNEVQDDAITTHLALCKDCREKLEIYRHLMAGISKIETETFPFDVTTVVMEKIKEVETNKEKNTNMVLYMSLSIVSLIALGLLYPYVKIIFTQFKSFSIMANVFILVSVLGVIVFIVNDLFRQYKQKEMLLSQ
jgi:hypothetical protein